MTRLPFEIPRELASQAILGKPWAEWLNRLPRLTAELADDWQLTFDGPPSYGFTSLVAPVQSSSGPAALKVTFDGDDESLYEGLALQHWAGRGTVRLLRSDPRRRALLLERLHTDDLTSLPDLDACEVVANAYRHLHVPALPQLHLLTSYLQEWNAGLASLPSGGPLPHRLVEQAVSVANTLIADPASAGTIIHGDLHFENVLAADREPWLVIDPKPMSGDPHYEVAPLLWNRWDEMVDTGNLRVAIRHRFHTVIDAAGFDEDRARDWVIVRALHNAFWSVDDARRLNRPIDEDGRDWLTRMISVAKYVQD